MRRVQNVQNAFPDAFVQNYEPLINALTLPDEKDRHVLAAAIKINANIIVTNNLKHFPDEYLSRFDIAAKSADDFLTDIIDLNPQQAVEAFREMVRHKRRPPLNELEVLAKLKFLGLVNTSDYLHSQI